MKKLVIALILGLFCLSASAQTYRYRASSYAFGERNSYGNIVWDEWEDCNVIITIDLDRDFIKVYSKREQNYVIVHCGDEYTDNSRGKSVDMTAVDEEGIECTVRLRVQDDGVIQLYAFYNNIAWVYSDLEML